MIDQSTIAFIIAASVLTITPGNDTMLIVRNALARGRASGFASLFGICSGLVFHGSFAALGLSVVLMQSPTAFNVVKYVGGAFLIVLGLLAGREAWRAFHQRDAVELATAPRDVKGPIARTIAQIQKSMSQSSQGSGARRSYIEGLLTNLLNPKVALFYLSFLPQFVGPKDPFYKPLILAAAHILLGIVWLSLLILLISRMRTVIARPRNKAIIELIAAVVLIGLGIRLAILH